MSKAIGQCLFLHNKIPLLHGGCSCYTWGVTNFLDYDPTMWKVLALCLYKLLGSLLALIKHLYSLYMRSIVSSSKPLMLLFLNVEKAPGHRKSAENMV